MTLTMTWVLILDDDLDNRELLAEFLESVGYTVTSAGTAADADRILDDRGRPCVVLADILLPDKDGTEFVRTMKSRPGFEDTPVIFLTGVHPSKRKSVDEPVLMKPFDLDLLVDMVAEHCAPPSLDQPLIAVASE